MGKSPMAAYDTISMQATEQKLDELIQYIKRILPQSKDLSQIHKDSQAGIVTFMWKCHKFAVKPSLEVLELKGNNLFITGASMLMQTAFTKYEKDSRVLGVVDETLGQVEDFLSHAETEKGLGLLTTVKQTLAKLGGPQTAQKMGRTRALGHS